MDGEAMRREPTDADLKPFGWQPGNWTYICKGCRGREWQGCGDWEGAPLCRSCAVKRWELALVSGAGTANTPEAGEVEDRQNGTDEVGATPSIIPRPSREEMDEHAAMLRAGLQATDPTPPDTQTAQAKTLLAPASVEAVARAICAAVPCDPDEPIIDNHRGIENPMLRMPAWQYYEAEARAAIKSILPLLSNQTAQAIARAEQEADAHHSDAVRYREQSKLNWQSFKAERARAEEAERKVAEMSALLTPPEVELARAHNRAGIAEAKLVIAKRRAEEAEREVVDLTWQRRRAEERADAAEAQIASLREGMEKAVGALAPFCFGDPVLERILFDDKPDNAATNFTIALGELRRAREVYRTLSKTSEKTHDA